MKDETELNQRREVILSVLEQLETKTDLTWASTEVRFEHFAKAASPWGGTRVMPSYRTSFENLEVCVGLREVRIALSLMACNYDSYSLRIRNETTSEEISASDKVVDSYGHSLKKIYTDIARRFSS